MNNRALQTLAVIDEIGSFSQAAERLNMTLSAVSMQMKALEAELGVDLFNRAFRPPKLTPLGQAVARRAAGIVRSHAEVRALCSGGASLAGLYRLGFVWTASVRLLPTFLRNARAVFPEAQFLIETGLSEDLARKVRQGDLDAAVVTQVDADWDARFAPLRTEELVFAVPVSAGERTIAACVETLPFIQFTPETGIGRLVARYLREAGMKPAEVIVLDGVEAVMECVTVGLGFTALPRPDVLRYGREAVVVHAMSDPPLTRTLGLVAHDDRLGGRAFSDMASLFGGGP